MSHEIRADSVQVGDVIRDDNDLDLRPRPVEQVNRDGSRIKIIFIGGGWLRRAADAQVTLINRAR